MGKNKHMSNFKILMLTSWYPDNTNPYEGIFVKEQAKALSAVCDLTLVHVKIDYNAFRPFFSYKLKTNDEAPFKEMRLSVYRSFPVYNQLNFFALTVWQLYKRLKTESFDAIHCQVSYPAGIVGMILAGMMKIPLIITEHFGGFTGLFRSKMHRYLIMKAMKKAAAVTTVSHASAHIIGEHIKRKIDVIPNMINIAQFRLHKRERKGGKIVVGFLGGLNTNVKGLDILLEATAKLKNPDLFLKIGGDGILLESYQKRANALGIDEQCEFLGIIHPNERQTFYEGIDFFVLPSRRESFGIVLLEALACGKPVLASRCGGPEDIVHAENGLLVEPENVEALSSGLQKMVIQLDSFRPHELRTDVQVKFGSDAFVKRVLSAYTKVIHKENV